MKDGNYKKYTTVHVIPKSNTVKKDSPSVYCYHPEQYPELA